jgi:hypothetical protein
MLFFQAKSKGNLTVTLDASAGPPGAPPATGNERAVVHVP